MTAVSINRTIFTKVFNISESLTLAYPIEYKSELLAIGVTQTFDFVGYLISNSPLKVDYGYWSNPDVITEHQGKYLFLLKLCTKYSKFLT